jgi:hypothetical protein
VSTATDEPCLVEWRPVWTHWGQRDDCAIIGICDNRDVRFVGGVRQEPDGRIFIEDLSPWALLARARFGIISSTSLARARGRSSTIGLQEERLETRTTKQFVSHHVMLRTEYIHRIRALSGAVL